VTIVIESRLTTADWTALLKVMAERVHDRVGVARVLLAVLPLGLVAMLATYVQAPGQPERALVAFALGVFAIWTTSLILARLQRRATIPDDDGHILGPVRTELSDEGIRTIRTTATSQTAWSAVRDVTVTDAHVFVWVDSVAAYILPIRDLPGGLDAKGLVERIREFTGPMPASRAVPRHGPPDAGADHSAAHRPAVGFLALLVRRVAWLGVPEVPAASNDAVILGCGLVTVAVWLAFDRLRAGVGAHFYPGGVDAIAWYACGVLALAWVMHKASSRTAPLRSLLASTVGSLPLLLGLTLAIAQWAPAWAHRPGYALVALVAILRASQALAGAGSGRQPATLMAGASFALLFAIATSQTWISARFWFPARGDVEDDDSEWVETERMLFGLADRIDEAAGRVARGQPGQPDVFFLGFAGVAEQKVFAEELKLAERVVSERYRAAGRSLLLVNDERDHDAWPIATVQGLRRALVRIAARMDPTEDVLFLLLTSHGSGQTGLSVSNGAWSLESLDGPELRSALDASGIRWRVIVISACHSGTFVQPLADENTIVLTAAAEDRTSFGCGDDDELTYFGEALMRDALPEAESLGVAFERAKAAIAARERREMLRQSLPQSHFGSAMREHWERVEALRHGERSGPRDPVLPAPRLSP
jgi:hypothetical protein